MKRKWVYRHHLYAKVRVRWDDPPSCHPLIIDPHDSTSRQTYTRDTDLSLRRLSLRLLRITSVERLRFYGANCMCGLTLILKSVFRTFCHFY